MSNADRIEELRNKYEENPRRYFAPLANEFRKAGDLAQAIAICREHLPKQPGHMSGYIVFGQTLYEANTLDEARAVFEQALALDPENLIALKHLGDIARRKGENAVARRWYERVLDADPRNDEIATLLASLPAPTPPLAMPAVAQPRSHAPINLDDASGVFRSFDPGALLDVPENVIAGDTARADWEPRPTASPRMAPAQEPIDLDFPDDPEPVASDEQPQEFEEGLLAPQWPDTADLVARVSTPYRGVTPLSVPVSQEAVDAFGREAHDAHAARGDGVPSDLQLDDSFVDAYQPPSLAATPDVASEAEPTFAGPDVMPDGVREPALHASESARETDAKTVAVDDNSRDDRDSVDKVSHVATADSSFATNDVRTLSDARATNHWLDDAVASNDVVEQGAASAPQLSDDFGQVFARNQIVDDTHDAQPFITDAAHSAAGSAQFEDTAEYHVKRTPVEVHAAWRFANVDDDHVSGLSQISEGTNDGSAFGGDTASADAGAIKVDAGDEHALSGVTVDVVVADAHEIDTARVNTGAADAAEADIVHVDALAGDAHLVAPQAVDETVWGEAPVYPAAAVAASTSASQLDAPSVHASLFDTAAIHPFAVDAASVDAFEAPAPIVNSIAEDAAASDTLTSDATAAQDVVVNAAIDLKSEAITEDDTFFREFFAAPASENIFANATQDSFVPVHEFREQPAEAPQPTPTAEESFASLNPENSNDFAVSDALFSEPANADEHFAMHDRYHPDDGALDAVAAATIEDLAHETSAHDREAELLVAGATSENTREEGRELDQDFAKQDVSATLPPARPAEEQAPAFVTETMAELLVGQGFTQRALEIYEELVRRRPFDPVLSSRLAELRDQLTESVQSTRNLTPRSATPVRNTPLYATSAIATPISAALLQDEGWATTKFLQDNIPPVRTARERFADLALRRVSRRTPTHATAVADDAADGLSKLFGSAQPTTPDELAARALAEAFGPVQDSGKSLFDVPETAAPLAQLSSFTPRSNPAIHKSLAPNLSEPRADRPATADYSFDRFFPDPAIASNATASGSASVNAYSPTTTSTTPSPANEDLAQFSAWLKGLNNA